MNRTRLMTTMALFVAIGVLGSQFIWFPAGIAKAYPVQHAVNVLAAVLLGTTPAVIIAFLISLIRVLLGLGSILAFPGSMIGAFLAGILYKTFKKKRYAGLGEILGTGILGALFAIPYAKILMGTTFGAFFFIPPFLISSLAGTLIALFILGRIFDNRYVFNRYMEKENEKHG